MKIKSLSYGRTFNLGNFKSERILVEASVDESEQDILFEIKEQLRTIVEGLHR